MPGIGDLRDSIEYEKVLESNKDEKFNRLKAFILQLRNNTITIQNPGDFDELHFCLLLSFISIGDMGNKFVFSWKSRKMRNSGRTLISWDFHPIWRNFLLLKKDWSIYRC